MSISRVNNVTTLYRCTDCPLHKKTMDGPECTHPKFSYHNTGYAYAGQIITNSFGIPEKCPLRESSLLITHKLQL